MVVPLDTMAAMVSALPTATQTEVLDASGVEVPATATAEPTPTFQKRSTAPSL
jgi:hypothetical protein